MTYKFIIKISLLFIIVFFLGDVSHAAIYKWIDDDGVIHFSDKKDAIPENYLDATKEIRFENDNAIKSVPDISKLPQVIIDKEEVGFDGILFGADIDDFFSIKEGEAFKEKRSGKVTFIDGGLRRIGSTGVGVIYTFYENSYNKVKVSYEKDDEKRLVKELKAVLGEPDFERFPFIYWLYNGIELKLKRDEDHFFVFKKKIKKF